MCVDKVHDEMQNIIQFDLVSVQSKLYTHTSFKTGPFMHANAVIHVHAK